MKEIFSQAIQKMKRKDFLDDVVREKTAENTQISAEVALLRKKNGSRTGTELDLKIFQANAKKAETEKLISKCKAEAKTLKAEILELLTDCYAKADKPELVAKVEAAAYHAFDGKIKLLSDKEAGGLWGDCEIIGAVITHDKKKKNTTAKLVTAGAVNSTGMLIKRPKIYVYVYDKKQEEGILLPENDSFKTRAKQKKESKFLKHLASTYLNDNVYFALGIVALYAIFSVWAVVGGFASTTFGEMQVRHSLVIGIVLGVFTLSTLKTAKKGGIADFLPLCAIDVSLVAFACAFGYTSVLRAMIFPAILFTYGVVAIFLRYKRGNASGEKTSLEYLTSVMLGILLTLVFKKIGRTPMAYWITLTSVVGVGICTASVLSVIKRGTKIGEQGSFVAFGGLTFCALTSLSVPSTLVSCLFLLGAGISGLAPILAKFLLLKDKK